ncbi:MAG: flagellar biosynthesis protein FlhF, partial [Planctomycetota bacterium]
MALKVYRARSMNDALAEVKRDLGSDAVILHTRNYKTGGLFGLGARSIVEITATTDDSPPTRRPTP